MKKQPDNLRIALAGGGSGGPVAPLLAIAEELRTHHHDAHFLLLGTNQGPESTMAEQYKIPFKAISAGKLRRYISIMTLAAPFQSVTGFFQARRLLKKFKADVFVAAGGFVSVPAGYAAWSLRIPVLIHQQDIVPTMSNKLLAPIADVITTTFQKSLKDFSGQSMLSLSSRTASAADHPERCVWTGDPARPEFAETAMYARSSSEHEQELRAQFGISGDWPVLLITGGGTGAAGLNEIVHDALPELLQRFEVIHATGSGKSFSYEHERYHQFEFIAKMPEAFAIAEVVICRAGVGTITELSATKKPAIVVPMPDSHQEENALYLHDCSAAMIYAQPLLDGNRLYSIASALLYDADLKANLAEHIAKIMPPDATKRISQIIISLAKENHE